MVTAILKTSEENVRRGRVVSGGEPYPLTAGLWSCPRVSGLGDDLSSHQARRHCEETLTAKILRKCSVGTSISCDGHAKLLTTAFCTVCRLDETSCGMVQPLSRNRDFPQTRWELNKDNGMLLGRNA